MGSYAITPKGLTAENYAIEFKSGTLTVEQKEVTLSWGSTELTYTGSVQAPTATATGMVNGDEIGVTVTGGQTDAGEDYTATASALTGSKAGNYKLPALNTTTFRIAKVTIKPTVTLEGWIYGETANTPVITGNLGNGAVKWVYYTDEACTTKTTAENSGAASEGAVPANAGTYYVIASIAEMENTYAWTAAEPISFTIDKAVIAITADDKSSAYGEPLAELTYRISGDDKAGDDLGITLTTTASETANAGTYPITVSWNENANYTATLTDGAYVIAKATMDKADLTAGQKPTARTDLEYDGSDQALATAPSALPDGYTIRYSKDGGETWTDMIPTGKAAGAYTVQVRYVGDGNHADFAGDPLTVTICLHHTVRFHTDGGTEVTEQTVLDGDRAVKPADPVKGDNAFGGWYEDAAFVKSFDFGTPIIDDITLYAKWTQDSDEPEAATYSFTGGDGQSWTKGSTTALNFTVKRSVNDSLTFGQFKGIEIDGTAVSTDQYTATAGSVNICLKTAYLDTLAAGEHTITVLLSDGAADAKFTVLAAEDDKDDDKKDDDKQEDGSNKSGGKRSASKKDRKSPKTGDESALAMWTLLSASAGAMMVMLIADGKRKYRK